MTRALACWLLAAVLSLLAGILAALGWRTLATLDDAWDVAVDVRVNPQVNVVSGGMLAGPGRAALADDAANYRLAERMGALHVGLNWSPGSLS